MLENVRAKSLNEAKRLGYPVNINLPMVDFSDSHRDGLEIGRRLLTLYAVVSSSYGFSKEESLNWLTQERLENELTRDELLFLNKETSEAQKNAMQWQVEALWALAWAVSLHDVLDFGDSCDNNFVHLLPDLKKGKSSQSFLSNLKLRKFDDLVEKCDLAYCLHWGAREAALLGSTIRGAVPSNVVLERRKALEWLISNQAWDEVNLDT